MKIKDILDEKKLTMMYDRMNSDTEEVMKISDVEDLLKKCFKAQRDKCVDRIKEFNYTLAELVRITDEPTDVE